MSPIRSLPISGLEEVIAKALEGATGTSVGVTVTAISFDKLFPDTTGTLSLNFGPARANFDDFTDPPGLDVNHDRPATT